jgi:hypothetical protein
VNRKKRLINFTSFYQLFSGIKGSISRDGGFMDLTNRGQQHVYRNKGVCPEGYFVLVV